MYKKQIFCFVGETNSGKDTIVNRICEIDKRFSTVISYTSRPKEIMKQMVLNITLLIVILLRIL